VNLQHDLCALAGGARRLTFLCREHGDFKTRFVRLAFTHTLGDNKRRRYRLFWDAALTGGTTDTNQVASR
jgi:DNA transposition AAA+ family ATPase